MSEQSEFEKWRKSVNDNLWSMDYERGVKRGWQACTERSKEGIEFLTATLEAETKKRRQLEIDNAALRGFSKELSEYVKTAGSGGLVYSSSIFDKYRKFSLIDENGNPTKLLTGETADG